MSENQITIKNLSKVSDNGFNALKNINLEVKKGETGSSLREGIGQSLVYSSAFDFVVYLYVDISKDKKIRDSMNGKKEQELINDLWDNHNALFQVV